MFCNRKSTVNAREIEIVLAISAAFAKFTECERLNSTFTLGRIDVLRIKRSSVVYCTSGFVFYGDSLIRFGVRFFEYADETLHMDVPITLYDSARPHLGSLYPVRGTKPGNQGIGFWKDDNIVFLAHGSPKKFVDALLELKAA